MDKPESYKVIDVSAQAPVMQALLNNYFEDGYRILMIVGERMIMAYVGADQIQPSEGTFSVPGLEGHD